MMDGLLGQWSQALLQPAQDTDCAALSCAACERRLKKNDFIRLALPHPYRVIGESHSGRDAGPEVIHSEVDGAVVRIDHRDEGDAGSAEDVGDDWRGLLRELELDGEIELLLRHL